MSLDEQRVGGGRNELKRKEHEMTPSSIVPKAHEEQTHPTMMAWRVHEFGPPEVMKFEQIPRPQPGPGEVLVKVAAAGVGPWDDWISGREERFATTASAHLRARPIW